MGDHIYLGLNQTVNEKQLYISIAHVLAHEEKDTFIILHFHYGEIFMLKEYILQLFGGKFVDGKQFKDIVIHSITDLGFNIQDLLKPQFTASFGPEKLMFSKSLFHYKEKKYI